MNIADPLGLPGAPDETWADVQLSGVGRNWTGGHLILVTDRQGERAQAAYGALLTRPGETLVVARAFGPRFGLAGVRALSELVSWAQSVGLSLREAVLGGPDVAQLLAEPDAALAARAVAASMPLDPGVFLPGLGRL